MSDNVIQIGLQILNIVLLIGCGLLIGYAIYMLIKILRKMLKGSCCEGCKGCRHTGDCSSYDAEGISMSAQNRKGDENSGK